MPKQIYSIAICAINETRGHVVYHFRVMSTRNARSREEAIGIGIEHAKVFWPTEEGYTRHQADAIQVPPEWMEETP